MEFRRGKKTEPSLPQSVINSLALEFKEREWEWLNHLPPAYMRYLSKDEPFDPSLYTHYGEFFLTLCGIKPCLLITSHGHPTFAHDLYVNVLAPLMERLEGFELFRVNNFNAASSNQVVYIFASPFHQKFSLVEELFMKPHDAPVPTELLSKALGYPAPCGQSTFCYVDLTTTQELGVDCVTVFEFTAREGFDCTIKMHFEKCAAEFRKLGKVLTILTQ
jgi:hypothetical protein